jgi:hypothetical protein
MRSPCHLAFALGLLPLPVRELAQAAVTDVTTADAVSVAAAHSEPKGLIERIMHNDAECPAEHLGSHMGKPREGLAAMPGLTTN